MISIQNLFFSYTRRRPLFKGVSLTLQPGRIYGLLGRNGAGKSSLLRNMAGLLRPSKGILHVAGYNPQERQPAFLASLYFLPEEIFLPPISVDRYVTLMAPFYPNFNEPQFRRYLTEFDVPATGRVTDLSYGQRKKVLISFGLAANTSVLLMDEPTNGLDIPAKRQFRKLVASALDTNRLILISTHQVRDLDNLIDAVVILDGSDVLLNHPLDAIADRLQFDTVAQMDMDESVLYAEPSLRGYSVVLENAEQVATKVDLERLFNAVISNPDRIKHLFTDKSL